MPAKADAFDISIHDPIRDPPGEQRRRFMAALEQLSQEELDLLELTARALWPDAVSRALDHPPQEVPDGPDADLIRACDHLYAVQVARDAAYDVIPEGDDGRRRAVLDPLNARSSEIRAGILALSKGPKTAEGARAAAWTLLDLYPDGRDEAVQDCNLAAWLSIGLAEYVVGDEAEYVAREEPEPTTDQDHETPPASVQVAQQELMLLVMRALQPKQPSAHAGPDGELIRRCDHMHAIRVATNAAYEIIPDEKQRNAVLDPLYQKWFEAKHRIFDAEGPTTLEGAQAMAIVLLDEHPDGLETAAEADDLPVWLAIHCAEYLIDHVHPPEIGFGT